MVLFIVERIMTAVKSRFAVLKIDNDEEEKKAQRAKDKQKAAEMKLKQNPRERKHVITAEKAASKKKKLAQEKAEVIIIC